MANARQRRAGPTCRQWANIAVSQSFADLIAATARQKLAAAKARNNPDTTAEKPREAIFDALHMVRDALAADGFLLVPSRPKFIRKVGDFSFEIYIQSDRNNIAGQRAAIWVHVAVYSKSLTAWCKSHPSDWIRPKSTFPEPVYGNQIGYLGAHAEWLEWDFADKIVRRSVVERLIDLIKTDAFALFKRFEGPVTGITSLTNRDWPPPEGILKLLLSSGNMGLAEEVLGKYLDKRPADRIKFESLFQQFKRQGLPAYRSSTTHDLAAFAVASGYPWADCSEHPQDRGS
jgi:hypothetical protein